MTTADTFPRLARWDSVGLDCAFCIHERNPEGWPTDPTRYCCGLHGASLAVEIGPDGRKHGEWFCRDFQNNGKAHSAAVEHLRERFERFAAGVLFGFTAEGGALQELPLVRLGPCGTAPPA